MKKQILLLLALLLLGGMTFAQSVGINTDNSAPDNSALLDVKANNKGMLIPRVALSGTTDIATISSPATSLLVYNTATVSDVIPGYYYWNGTAWVKLITSSGTGQWTSSGSDIYYNAGHVGIGTSTPYGTLELKSGGDLRADQIGSTGGMGATLDLAGSVADGSPSKHIFIKDGNVGIGIENPQGALDISSTTGALIVPRMTTTQRDALTPAEGMIIYNTTFGKFQGYQTTGGSAVVLNIDTGSTALERSIVNGFWIMHQSFTASSSINITGLDILTNITSSGGGTLDILAGNGTGGSVLYTQSITYTGCGSGICITHITLSTPFAITNGTSYTLRFSASSGVNFSTYTNTGNPYSGGQVYQNSTPQPSEDMFLKLYTTGIGMDWINF